MFISVWREDLLFVIVSPLIFMYLPTVFFITQAPSFPQSYDYMVTPQQPPVYLYTPPPTTNQPLSSPENKKVFKPKRQRGYTWVLIEDF